MPEISFDDIPIINKPKVAKSQDISFDDIPITKPKKEIGGVFSDIGPEIGKAAGEALQNIVGVANRGRQGPVEGLLATGRAALGIPQLVFSPLTGTWRSVVGHGLASAEHAAGSIIAPETAAKDDPQAMYEQAKADADRAAMALRPAGGPIRTAAAAARGPYEIPPTRPAYEWQAPAAPPAKPVAPVVAASERLREIGAPVDVPRAIASESMIAQRAGQGLSNIPFIGNPITRAVGQLPEQLGGAAQTIAGEYGTGTGPNVASRIGRSMGEAATAESQAAREAAAQSDAALLAEWERANQERTRGIDIRQAQSEQTARQQFGDVTPQEMGEGTLGTVRAAERSAEATKNRLYDIAAQSEGTIAAPAVQGVRASVAQELENAGRVVDPQLTPASSRMLGDLENFQNLRIPNQAVGARVPAAGDETIAGVSLQGVERQRKRLNSMARAASNDEDRAAARRIVNAFDDWHNDAMQSSLLSGDANALETFQRARAANRDWRERFGYNERDDADRIINKMATEQVTPQEVANWLIGSGKVGSKGVSSRLLGRVMEATGNDPNTTQAIRGAIWNKLSGATEGATARGPEKIASDIYEFLHGSGRDMAQRLYSAQDQTLMRSHADTVRGAAQAREASTGIAKITKPTPGEVSKGPMQELAERVLGQGQKSDEALFNTIDAYAKSGNRGDIQTLGKLLTQIPVEDRGNLAASIVRNLGVSKRTGQFSPDVFASEWKTYTPQAKSLLFGNAGAHRKALDDIATIAQQYKNVRSRYGNPSGSAQNLNFSTLTALMTGAIGGTFLGPVKAIAIPLGGYGVAKLLASPAGASSLSRWSKIGDALNKRPTMRGIAAFKLATRNLTNTAQSLGVDTASLQENK